MSISAEYLLPQDMVLLRDNETGIVTTTHATDAKEALLHDEGRYELVLPARAPRPSGIRPAPLDTVYLASELRAADPAQRVKDEEHANKRREEDEARQRGPNEPPADHPQAFDERADATKGPLG
jgi:hypothetical protein